MSKPSLVTCIECDSVATDVRFTQFSGEHPYCHYHALKESDYGKDDSYAFWVSNKKGFYENSNYDKVK